MSETNQPINQYFLDKSEQVSITDLVFGVWDYKYFAIALMIFFNVVAYLFFYSQPKIYENSIKIEMSNKINFDLLPGFVEKIELLGMTKIEFLEQFSSETLSEEILNKTYKDSKVKEVLEEYNINKDDYMNIFSIEKFLVKTTEDITTGRLIDIYEFILTISSEITSEKTQIIFDKHLENSLYSTNSKFISWLEDYGNYLDGEMKYTQEKYKNLNDTHADTLSKQLERLRREQELNILMEIESLKDDLDIAKTLGIEIPIVNVRYLEDIDEEFNLFNGKQKSNEETKNDSNEERSNDASSIEEIDVMTDFFMEDMVNYRNKDKIYKFFFGTVVLEKIINNKENQLKMDTGPISKQEAALLARISNDDYLYDKKRDLELSKLISQKRNVQSIHEEFKKSKIFLPFVKFDTDQIFTKGVKISSLYVFLSTLACAFILTFIISLVWPEYKRRYYNH